MIKNRTFLSPDGFMFSAYNSQPRDRKKGGIIVIHDNLGVNAYIREVCDQFSKDGYEVIAPALFDRIEKRIEIECDEPNALHGRQAHNKLGWDNPIRDINTCIEILRQSVSTVGILGFSLGATFAWLASSRLSVDCAVCYHGSQIFQFLSESPNCPIMLHFGEQDKATDIKNIAKINSLHRDAIVHLYSKADYGFNCYLHSSFDQESALTAHQRTTTFFENFLS